MEALEIHQRIDKDNDCTYIHNRFLQNIHIRSLT